MMQDDFDLVIFGATSVLVQTLVERHKPWFRAHVKRLVLTQRQAEVPPVFADMAPEVIQLDCSDPVAFEAALLPLAASFKESQRRLCLFPTYGQFTFDYAAKNPVFRHQRDDLQINLNSRLQIIAAFRDHPMARFHLFGSLLGNFPYLGGYATAMWSIAQLPRNAEYRDLNLIIYTLGGMKTRFWDHARRPDFAPFVHDDLPVDFIFQTGFRHPENRGVHTKYPSLLSRVATWVGRRGLRPF